MQSRPKKEKTPEQIEYAQHVAAWMDAARSGDVAALEAALEGREWLLSNRSEKTVDAALGNTALHWATAKGQPEAAVWLLRRGAELQAKSHLRRHSIQVTSHKLQVTSHELQVTSYELQVQAKNHGGSTPLHAAASHGRGDMVLLLLDEGASAEATHVTK